MENSSLGCLTRALCRDSVVKERGGVFGVFTLLLSRSKLGGGGGLQAVEEEIYWFGWEDRRGKGSYAGDYNPMRLSAV
jgi:hypothetical protein